MRNVFNDAIDLGKRMSELVTASYDARGPWTTLAGMNVGPGCVFAESLETVDNERAAYGGLIAVVLRNLCKRFKEEAQPGAQWGKLSRRFEGYTIFQVLRACSNNFRHFDDWSTTNPIRPDTRADIAVIAAVMGWPVPADDDNLRAAFGRNVAWLVLHQIAKTYDDLEKLVVDVAEELLSACAVPLGPTLDVARKF